MNVKIVEHAKYIWIEIHMLIIATQINNIVMLLCCKLLLSKLLHIEKSKKKKKAIYVWIVEHSFLFQRMHFCETVIASLFQLSTQVTWI